MNLIDRTSAITMAAIATAVILAGPARAAGPQADAYREMAHDLISGIERAWRPSTGSDNVDEALGYLKKAYRKAGRPFFWVAGKGKGGHDWRARS